MEDLKILEKIIRQGNLLIAMEKEIKLVLIKKHIELLRELLEVRKDILLIKKGLLK